MDTHQTDDAGLTPEARLRNLGISLHGKLEEAKKARKESGVEAVWLQCEEAYLGVDELNRNDWIKAKWAKPFSMEGPVTVEGQPEDDSKSKAYVRLTARYVDCGAAKMREILLPTDEKIFSLTATPVPDRPEEMPGAPMPGAPMPGAPMPGAPMPGAPMLPADKGTPEEKAERRISDWLVEAKFSRVARAAIHDAARLGTGIVKGPFVESRKSRMVTKEAGAVALKLKEKLAPGAKCVDPWNLFPDGACGEDIHNGEHVFERDFLSPRALKALKKLPGYLVDQIDIVIKEGPGKAFVENSNPNARLSDKRYEVYYYYGTLDRSDMELCKAVGVEGLPQEKSEVFAIVTMINDTVIRASINPLDSGAFPYRVMNWQRRAGHWAGIGVAEQVHTPQKIVVAATRGLLNNAGRSAGSQVILDNNAITPADNKWTITNEKIWYKSGDALVDDVRKAFMLVQFPNTTPQMMTIIEYAFRLAEESTNIPLISQGQSGATTPDTLGATQLQNNNANQLLRDVGAAWDDDITKPFIGDMYEWLLLDPNVPSDEKGDFQINVHGSELVERNIQQTQIVQIINMSANPAFEIDPAKASDELLRSWRFDPRAFKLDDTKKQELANRPPPEAPQVTVAKIRAQSDERRAKLDTDRDTAYVQAQGRRDEIMATARIEELRLKREIAYLEAQLKKGIELDANKVKLADTAAKLRVQKELAFANHANQQLMKPPTEPPGRAQPGRAFEQ